MNWVLGIRATVRRNRGCVTGNKGKALVISSFLFWLRGSESYPLFLNISIWWSPKWMKLTWSWEIHAYARTDKVTIWIESIVGLGLGRSIKAAWLISKDDMYFTSSPFPCPWQTLLINHCNILSSWVQMQPHNLFQHKLLPINRSDVLAISI